MSSLPFTRDPADPFFLGILDRFQSPLSRGVLYIIYRDVFGHVDQMAELWECFWESLEDKDVIDVASPKTSFYNVVLAKRGAPAVISHEMAKKHVFLLSITTSSSRDVASAMNYFFNEIIQELRRSVRRVA